MANNIIKSAEILCVGTELLLGDIINTNASYLARQLASLGIGVYRQGVVGDNPARLKKALGEALERADLVIMSGGLGPTCDDLTKETAAEFFGRKMYLDRPSLAVIEKYFSARQRKMTQNNVKQAMMPEGAIVFPNDYGTAPALAIEGTIKDGGEIKTVILLPGPPRELEPLFRERVIPYLQGRSENILFSKNINLYGIGESAAEELMLDIMKNSVNPTIAPYCADGMMRLRVTASAANEEEARALCDAKIAEVRQTPVAPYIYDVDSPSIEASVVNYLREKGMTLACAESCTGGLVAKRITDVAGCSDVFMGGCVTYSNESKVKLLGVNEATIKEHGAVSAQVAIEMARGIRERLGVDVGISTTGIAGPGGGTPEKPVGTVYVAISCKGDVERVKLLHLSSMRERAYLRMLSANEALAQLFNI